MTRPARARWRAGISDETGIQLGLRANLGQFILLAVVNFFVGGMAAWKAGGGRAERTELISASRLDGRAVLDVRQVAEYVSGHIPGAVHAELGDLPGRAPGTPEGAVVMCGHGERAMTAASLLARAGHTGLAVLAGGAQDWAAATGRPLQEGP